jgi:hypothetical protein
MGLRARALEVGVLATFAMRPVTRHIAETARSLLLSVHVVPFAGQLMLSLPGLLDVFCGTGRPA